ncbi:peroxidase [Favolaschia claudopus]|uniref:Peroxidase n=1 Tax=Favolaschia claudopus TaxID=2862362 RepID=A0AAW0CM89_9AGAR
MRLSLFVQLACALPLVIGQGAVFHWPDPLLDSIEAQLYVDHLSPLSTATLNCRTRDLSTVAAQWLRMGFHDMATHDKETGKGGLDASIIYELARAQNVGLGMRKTLVDYLSSPNEYVGMADVIAMGVVMSVFGCGGPIIPFRAGRLDAHEAGPEIVPQPDQDLDSHRAAFVRMGFNESEMIALTACGHTLGGVRTVDFPDIIDVNKPPRLVGIAFQVPITFDNSVVTEYLDNSTINPLVVGPNMTMASDFRIFNADKNVTMQKLADPKTYNSVCADLIARMIDVVPSNVKLTDPILPIDYKVQNTFLFPQGGSLAFLATLRTLQPQNEDIRAALAAPIRNVTLRWASRTGNFCPPEGCAAESFLLDYDTGSAMAELSGVAQWAYYHFNATVDLKTSISHFWFEIDPKNGTAPYVVDNHGTNFTIEQDTLLYDARRSEYTPQKYTMVAAVKNQGLASVSTFSTIQGSPLDHIPVNGSATIHFTLDPKHPPKDGYTFYSGTISEKSLSNTLHATVGGKKFSQWVPVLSTTGV